MDIDSIKSYSVDYLTNTLKNIKYHYSDFSNAEKWIAFFSKESDITYYACYAERVLNILNTILYDEVSCRHIDTDIVRLEILYNERFLYK